MRGVNLKKIFKIILTLVLLAPVLTVVSIPFINNYIAYSVKKDVMSLPLPAKTKRGDAVSSAGKFVGKGNGMQFFGAILIKSDK
ncbi:hypothetical protein SAMN05444162_0020 [Paenibacillaceae bacterium GAS479]|nr:hypothetical protein SAMN05444162_0020 [Paenibacillaceae bacterium GAS479]